MNKVGLWQVLGGRLDRIREGAVDLEKSLEDWICEDPSLVQAGLVIVGRQIVTEGGKLDLLAIDPQGCWAVIEIKKNALRRETIAQVLDYASCIASMPADELRAKIEPYLAQQSLNLDDILSQRGAGFALDPEQRELTLMLVGTGRAPGLERMTHFLATRYGIPLTLISFEVFALDDQRQILCREITEVETAGFLPLPVPPTSLGQVLDLAEQNGTAQALRHCLKVTEELGLYARPWKTCIMFAPPTNRVRALFTIWAQPKESLLRMWVGNKVFAEFYPVSEESVQSRLGSEGWQFRDSEQLESFLRGLKSLFMQMQSVEDQGSE